MLPSNISPESLPDKFNEFFVHKIEEIRSSFDPDRPIPTNPVAFSGTVFAEFQLVTEDFVKKKKNVLQEMLQKSCDLDPIPIPVLCDCLDEITPIVTSIINKSLSSGIVPRCLNMFLSSLCYKKASLDPNCLKHYRPVSNLPFLSKVACFQIATLVKGTGAYCPETDFQHLRSHSLLDPFQFAYPKCHSTETAMLRVENDLLQASDSGCVSILSLLDLSAAFNTTDHNILITRLRTTFGCSGTVLNWFISYLSCRTQSVFVGHESTPSVLQHGVPSATWSAAEFCSGTSSIYSVYTHSKYCYLSVWSFISFLCR